MENLVLIGYTDVMKRMSLGLLGALVVACGNDEVDCSTQMRTDWAIEITFDSAGDACVYEGTLTLEGGATEDLSCGPDGATCRCVGGNEFGIYEVTITDPQAGTTDRAMIEVEPAASPICYVRDTLEDFSRGMGGGGGAGGAP